MSVTTLDSQKVFRNMEEALQHEMMAGLLHWFRLIKQFRELERADDNPAVAHTPSLIMLITGGQRLKLLAMAVGLPADAGFTVGDIQAMVECLTMSLEEWHNPMPTDQKKQILEAIDAL